MNTHVKKNNNNNFEKEKVIRISTGRQITIPKKYYKKLGLNREAVCTIKNGELVIKPLKKESSDFAVEILKDLQKKGYTGDELVKHFKIANENIKKSISNMREESRKIASDEIEGVNFEDIFEEK